MRLVLVRHGESVWNRENRAIHTLNLLLDEMDRQWLPVVKSWKLNERHYGALQGLNKGETVEKYGESQVKIWRRSFDVQPPILEKDDPRSPHREIAYSHESEADMPLTESLKDTIARVVPYFNREIKPQIESGKRVLIVAHGNSLRALMKYLENISDEEIVNVNIPTGMPLVHEFNENFEVMDKFHPGTEVTDRKGVL